MVTIVRLAQGNNRYRQILFLYFCTSLPTSAIGWDVTTWHNAVDRLGTFHTLQNVRQQHCKRHNDSGQQVSALPDMHWQLQQSV